MINTQEIAKVHKERALQILADSALGPTQKYAALGSIAEALAYKEFNNNRPRIVCLCGSTRLYKEFQEENFRLTMEGFIVLTVGFYPNAPRLALYGEHAGDVGVTPEQKEALDELHKRKIDLADWVYVIDVDGYIGSSTRSEINYALERRMPIRYRSHRVAEFRATGFESTNQGAPLGYTNQGEKL
jgi:hypothetical protein